ncbi:hypothetical protein BDP27DRAFT_1330117 [Rhodocollybia butyracea]|uniref:Uncharacterized protein n=1 Tax=Rhodocollybia butyracea TaxID=206335 RepID=A0A9P5PML4_9AGAR|nr:hypothetical protein BDP27DRAFT_1330117 [Rhodocollybia butyracea]
MHFTSTLLGFASIVSVASASLLMQRQCTGIFQPCVTGTQPSACCEGLTCTVGSPLGNCMPTPGVCGVAGTQCSAVLPTNSCCAGLSCSGSVGVCQ